MVGCHCVSSIYEIVGIYVFDYCACLHRILSLWKIFRIHVLLYPDVAARGGHADVLEYLISEGGSHLINDRTNNGVGPNALWLAENNLEKNKEAIRVLTKNGAISLAPTTLTIQF